MALQAMENVIISFIVELGTSNLVQITVKR